MRSDIMKRMISFMLAMVLLFSCVPANVLATETESNQEPETTSSVTTGFEGKTISILGDSISTYQDYSNGAAAETTNSTIANGAIYYPRSGFEVTAESTWWYQAAQALGMEILVNNSWSGSCLLNTRSGTVGAYVDRCVQLHDDTGEDAGQKPDIIAIFLGTNDYYTYPGTLGSYEGIDFGSLITETEEGFAYAEPTTSLEAYAISLHKIGQAYPDAEVYCFTLLPRLNSTSQPTAFNEDVKQLAAHFGVSVVDLYDCGINSETEAFYVHMGDSLHPDVAGMDAITNAFVSAVMKNSGLAVHDVTFALEGAVAMEGTTRTVVSGGTFEATLAPLDASVPLEVTVTMGGEDITESCCRDNIVTIPAVTGEVVITAKPGQREPMNFRWETQTDSLVSVNTDGNTENPLTMTHGSIDDGVFSKTRFTMSQGISLRHDLPWCVEWKSSGTWTDTTDGALLFSQANTSSTADACYFYRRHNNDFFAFGTYTGGKYHNYGVKFAGTGIDTTAEHVFRLENRIASDGSNMVYLYVDDVEVGPLNHHYIGGTDQQETVDWVSGKDFTFSYMGTSPHTIGGCSLDYVQVWEKGVPCSHSYTAEVTLPTCTEQGYTDYTCSLCGDSYRTQWLNETAYEGMTIACVGDSITAAYGVTKDETDYVTLLAQQLGMDYIRLGVSGTTLCTDGSRTCNIGKLTETNLNGADVVTIAMGINDFCAAGAGYYELGDIHSTDTSTIYGAVRMWCERIVELRKTDSLSDTQFYFLTPVITSWNNSVTSNRDWDQSKTNIHGDTLRDLCNAIMEVAALYDVAVIDLNLLSGMYYVDATDNNTAVFGGDGVHPGEKGHEMMASALANVLLQNNLRDDHAHTFGSWITTTWPSCCAGEQQRVCAVCSATESRVLESNDNHRYCAVITAPTYTEQGYTTYTCSICGDSYVSDYTDAIQPHSYRWEMQDDTVVSVTTEGNTANALTLNSGSITDGTLTSVRYTLQSEVRLYHNLPWVIEWRSTGNWSGMLLGSALQSPSDGLTYLFRDTGTKLFAFGEYNGSWNNYGIILDCDMTVSHVFRLENRIAPDGSNAVYLLVDGQEIDAMHHYYIAGTNQNQTVNWANGKDIVFANIGTTSHPVKGMKLEYFQVHEGGEPEILEGKTISILGASMSTFAGTSNGAAAETSNSTIADNAAYYPNDTIPEVTLNDTWWMQVAEDLDLRLLVNNSWSGSSLLYERRGTVGAYVDRCVRLHDDTGDNAGEMPDIIGIQMGTNDYQYYKDTLGTADIDYDTLIVAGEDGTYTYAEPTTSLEAAAIVMHKISIRYPDAEVYYLNLSQRVDITDETAGILETFNEDLATVCAHFDVTIVDIYNSGITQDNFSTYIGDGRVHPNKFGMDAYTEAFKKALLGNHEELTAYTVDFQLSNVTPDYGVDKQVLSGKAFTCTLTAPEYFKPKVTVTMGGEDITDRCYADGVVTIYAVTADVVITAEAVLDHEPQNYRWEFDGSELATVTANGNTENVLTKLAGSNADGVFTTTSYSLEKTVVLSHDLPWSVEWKSEGTWKGTSTSGGRLFSTAPTSSSGTRYIFKSVNSYIIAMGERTSSGSYNYGIALADHDINGSERHIYRLENRIAEDGSNMVWLYVDGIEIGAMNNLFIGTTDQETTSDWLSGQDFLFPYIGTETHGLNNCSVDYVQVWEGGSDHYHTYTTQVTEPTYNEGGYTTYTCTGCSESYVADYTDPIALHTYRWELVEDAFVPVTTDGAEENVLSLQNGSISDGAFTNVLYTMDSSIHLYHDQPWVIEWKSSGDNSRTAGSTSGGSGLLSSNTVLKSDEGTWFLYKRPSTYLIALCYRDASTSIQSGIALADHGIDGSALHTYRLENRISADGSNMVYLLVDGTEIGAMNNLFVSAVDQGETTDFLNGLDWTFDYMGITNYYLNNCSIEYMQIWEGGEPTGYEGKVISVMGDSISTFAGYIPVADGYNREHLARYPQDDLLTDVNETWWMQVVAELDAKLGINESWRGSTLSGAVPVTTGDTGENAAMSNLIRIQNMGSNGTPDVILLYGGTNDLAHVSKVGTFDPDTAPTEVDLTTTKWDNLADGFVHTLLRMRYYYPDAVILAMLPTYTASYYTDEKLAEGNAVMAQICEHYGIPYVDLRDSGVTADHLPDGIHPGEEGMDLITAAVVEALLEKAALEPGEHVVYPVSHELTQVKASLGHWKGVDANSTFTEVLTGTEMTVTVTMDGVDITADCYKDGTITIETVTGALVITATGSFTLDGHLQQLPDPYCGINLWQTLEHDEMYYASGGWTTHASGQVTSVTFPVTPGDRLYASSFGAAGTNGGTINGIRVTYFAEDGTANSIGADTIYEEFSTNGYLTVPDDAVAVSIPMWTDSEDWEIYLYCVLHSHLQQLPEGAYNDTNLWQLLTHDPDYYSADGWVTHSSGNVKSVTIPVSPGDRLYASSFGAAGSNGSTTNGIRVTYFTQCSVLVSMTATQVYEEFSEHGYLTVPEGTTAVSIPMWTDSEDWELYILTLPDRPVITVEISWGAMEFTYTDGAWDPDSHSYGEGTWTPDNESNYITVANEGTLDTSVTFVYENAEGYAFTGSFADGDAVIDRTIQLPVNTTRTIWLTLTGRPEDYLNSVTIGYVTVIIQ